CRDSRPRLSGGAKLCRLGCSAPALTRSKRIAHRLSQQPRIFCPTKHHPRSHWIFKKVSHFRVEIFRKSEHVVERLRLPQPSVAAKNLVHPMRRSTFNSVHDLGKRIDFHILVIGQGRENHVNVVGHDDNCLQVKLDPVVMQIAIEHGLPSVVGKYPSLVCAERYEMRLVVDPQV
ncbi:MAG: hypothetical protein WAK56_06035, partial [Candidatus Sulfotelmatobacter sp.]